MDEKKKVAPKKVAKKKTKKKTVKKKPAARLSIEKQAVFSDPAQPGALGELSLEQRRGVDHTANAGVRNPIPQGVGKQPEIIMDAIMIIAAPTVTRNSAGSGRCRRRFDGSIRSAEHQQALQARQAK